MNRAHGRAAGIGLEVQHIGHQQDHLEDQVQVLMGLSRYRHHDHVAAPIFGQQPSVGKLLLDAFRLRVGPVDLVDGYYDRDFGRAGMVDGFERLRHDAIVRRHHQHHDIGDLGAAGAHAGESLMAGGVDEDDLAPVHLHLVRANMLGDAAGLVRGDVGYADGVEQRGFAVVHVAHDGDHRGALLQVPGVFGIFHRLHGFHFVADGSGGGAEFARHLGGQLGIEGLVDGGEDAAVHQLLHHQRSLHVQLFGQLLHRDAFGNGDFAVDGRRTGLHVAACGPQDLLFLLALARLRARGAFVPGTAACRLDRRWREARLDAAALGGGMLRTGAGGTARGDSRTHCRSGSGSGNYRLARANGALVNGPAWSGRCGGLGNAGTRRRGHGGHRRPRSTQFGCQVGARWYYGTGHGLPGERTRAGGRRRAGGYGHRRSGRRWRRLAAFGAALGPRTLNHLRTRGWTRHGRARSGSSHGLAGRRRILREGLTRAGKNLARPGAWRRRPRQRLGAGGAGRPGAITATGGTGDGAGGASCIVGTDGTGGVVGMDDTGSGAGTGAAGAGCGGGAAGAAGAARGPSGRDGACPATGG